MLNTIANQNVIDCCSESVATLFDSDVQFEFVINCAGETKLGQCDAVSSIDVQCLYLSLPP